MKRTANSTIEIISSLLILLFVYTAVSKLTDFWSFRHTLKESPLIGEYATLVAIALPVTELIVSILLFFPRTRLWGLYSSAALMFIFTLYLGYMIAFTPKKPCSCGGVLKQMTWNQHLVFNIFFFALSIAGSWLERKRKTINSDADLPQAVFT